MKGITFEFSKFFTVAVFVLAGLFMFGMRVHNAYAGSCDATTTGDWTTTTWTAGCTGIGGIPGTGDAVTIDSSVTITLDVATASLGSLTVNGTLDAYTNNLTVNGTTTIGATGIFTDSDISGLDLFAGAVTIDSGGVWDVTGDGNIEFQGGLTNNSSAGFTSGSGQYQFTTNAQSVSGSQSFTIDTVVNTSATGNGLTFTGAIPTVGALTQGVNSTLTFTGTVPSITTLFANNTNSTVVYASTTSGQTVKGASYRNLTISCTGQTATLGGITSVTGGGTLTVNAGATFELSTFSFSTSNTSTIAVYGTFNDNDATGLNTLAPTTGGITIYSGGTWSSTGDSDFTIRASFTVNSGATFSSGGGLYTFSGSPGTLGGAQPFTITNATNSATGGNGLTISSSNVTVGTLTQSTNAVLTFSGSMPSIGTLNATATNNTVQYTDTSAGQVIIDAPYKNLKINNSGQVATLSNTLTVSGNLIVTSGTLDVSSSNYGILLGGDFTQSGTFTARSGTLTLNGSAQQTLSGTFTGGSSLYDLTITNNSGVDASDGELTGFTPSVAYSSALTVTHNYTITTASVRVEHTSGLAYTFNNINWNGGASGTKIFFRNSVASGTWLLSVSGTQTAVAYMDVSRSDASGGNAVVATSSTNSGNNTNWSFGAGTTPTSHHRSRGDINPIPQVTIAPATPEISSPTSTPEPAPIEIPPTAIFIFTKFLRQGDNNLDVHELQRYLNAHGAVLALTGPGSPGDETTFFGVLTKRALITFQEAHALDILAPLHLTKGTGNFAAMTIRFVNANH